MEYLAAILNSKALIPFNGQGEKKVYFEALGPYMSGISLASKGSGRGIKLVFDTELLDRRDYGMAKGWHYGQQTDAKAGDLQANHEVTWDISHGFSGYGNEVFFDNPVELSHLKAIWVLPEQRSEALKILREAGFVPPDGRSLEEFVETRTTWP
jgi:hypothetical protein